MFEGSVAPPLAIEDIASSPEMRITFVMPSKHPDPIDVTPPASDPYANQPADLSWPALPSPPQRVSTPFGLYEKPDKDGWMK
jgi:hypothetical protein